MASTPAPPVGEEGEICKIGDQVVKPCAGTLTCTQQLSVAEQVPGRQLPTPGPGIAAGAGGLCGGNAGLQCTSGLACYITPEQQSFAGAFGTCERASRCTR